MSKHYRSAPYTLRLRLIFAGRVFDTCLFAKIRLNLLRLTGENVEMLLNRHICVRRESSSIRKKHTV